jgi:hypothetical protein
VSERDQSSYRKQQEVLSGKVQHIRATRACCAENTREVPTYMSVFAVEQLPQLTNPESRQGPSMGVSVDHVCVDLSENLGERVGARAS